jgi:hypothetical protein
MSRRTSPPLLVALLSLAAACSGDRGFLPSDGGAGAAAGAGGGGSAGSGGAGNGATFTGAAGSGGAAAGAGAAGFGGAAGQPATCDAKPVFEKYFCAVAGACHDARGSGGNFDMATAGWERKLVGVLPKGGGDIPSKCASLGRPYLIAGRLPAEGLFLDKLKPPPPCGDQDPLIGGPITPADLACIQSWANGIVADATGPLP